MYMKLLRSYILLFLTALIWGFAFVAQRKGMEHIGPFTYNGIRFILGATSLLPLITYRYKTKSIKVEKGIIHSGIVIGIFLFLGATLQQVGLIGTTAGKAAFITGLYIVIVPIIGICFGKKVKINEWLGIGLAVIGLYVLCLANKIMLSYYDALELIGAICFAIHILVVEHYVKKNNALILSCIQFATCGLLSLIIAVFNEVISVSSIIEAIIPIFYGGVFSVGIAYTLQVIGQKHVESSKAAIILSMESVFATLGGIILLNEPFGKRESWGCTLIFLGMILAQIKIGNIYFSKEKQKNI